MKYLYWLCAGLLSLWIEIVLTNYLRILDLKVNFVLITLLILTFRWASPFLLFYGLFLGLLCDSLSHSMIGVYGFSFFLTAILTRGVGTAFYESNFLSTTFFVTILSLIEGSIALSLLKVLNPEIAWNILFVTTTLPLAIIQGLLSPVFLVILLRCEKFLHLEPEALPS